MSVIADLVFIQNMLSFIAFRRIFTGKCINRRYLTVTECHASSEIQLAYQHATRRMQYEAIPLRFPNDSLIKNIESVTPI
jgi:hypothetical protein